MLPWGGVDRLSGCRIRRIDLLCLRLDVHHFLHRALVGRGDAGRFSDPHNYTGNLSVGKARRVHPCRTLAHWQERGIEKTRRVGPRLPNRLSRGFAGHADFCVGNHGAR